MTRSREAVGRADQSWHDLAVARARLGVAQALHSLRSRVSAATHGKDVSAEAAVVGNGREGARERLRRDGREALSEEELVALLLGTGSAGQPVTVLAARLLGSAGGLSGLSRVGLGALSGLGGIGESKAARLIAALELGRRVHQRPWTPGPRIETSRDVDELLRARLASLEAEHFVALALDAKNRVTAELKIAVGGLSACPVSPADVFRSLLREAAAGVVFAHNHPSGDFTPGADDLALTEHLVRGGALLGVRVLDHVIVARGGYFSFADAGLLRPTA